MKKFLVFFVLLVMCVPCSASDKVSAVCSNGTFNGVLSSDNVVMWLGVPYAKPPVGSLRWKAPQAPESSTETFEADKFSAMPIQKLRNDATSQMPQDEDCLYLNVWKASDDKAVARPVMVWIHGGSFRYNGTAKPEWLGHKLAADNPDIMVVSVGYRLGIMGFIDFSEVSGGEDFAESGNLGILDILQSLKWLKANISAFGGDPDNITLFGQSSGSALISLLMTMSEAQGLFQRAILQSGSVAMSMARKSAAEDAAELAKKLLDITKTTNMAGLMELTSKDLQDAAAQLDGQLNFPERDGVVLTSEDIYAAFAENAAGYDVLIGSNADEVRLFLGAIGSLEVYSDYVRSAYEQLVDAVSKIPDYGEALVKAAEDFIELQGDVEPVWAHTEFLNELLFRVPAIQMASSPSRTGRTYMYYWRIPTADPYLACHEIELPFVLDIPSEVVPAEFLNTEQGQGIRALVQNIWVDFAKDGVIDGMTEYTSPDLTTIVISPDEMPISLVNDPLSEQRQLITPLLALNFSGRDVINLVSAGDSGKSSEDIKPEYVDKVITKTYTLTHPAKVLWRISEVVSSSEGVEDFNISWNPSDAETVPTDKVAITISTIPGVTLKGNYDFTVQVSEDGVNWIDKQTLNFDTESSGGGDGTTLNSSGGGCDAGFSVVSLGIILSALLIRRKTR